MQGGDAVCTNGKFIGTCGKYAGAYRGGGCGSNNAKQTLRYTAEKFFYRITNFD